MEVTIHVLGTVAAQMSPKMFGYLFERAQRYEPAIIKIIPLRERGRDA